MKNATNNAYMIATAGTAEAPEGIINVMDTPAVHMSEIINSGNSLHHLACNALAGNVAPDMTTDEALKAWPRSLKNDKSAFRRLIDTKTSVIRAAYELSIKEAKRYTPPTLQALDKAVKAYSNPDAAGIKKPSVAEQVAEILLGKGTDKTKLAKIAELQAIAKLLNAE